MLLEEFIYGLAVLSRSPIEDKLKWIFDLYDVDGDGKLTYEDIMKITESIYNIMGDQAWPPFDSFVIKNHAFDVFKVCNKTK